VNWHDAMLAVMRGAEPGRPLFVPRPWNNLILSVADTLPTDADFDRILYIRDRAAEVPTP
jgi:hypothetical protein